MQAYGLLAALMRDATPARGGRKDAASTITGDACFSSTRITFANKALQPDSSPWKLPDSSNLCRSQSLRPMRKPIDASGVGLADDDGPQPELRRKVTSLDQAPECIIGLSQFIVCGSQR